jgi:hypothetical protein
MWQQHEYDLHALEQQQEAEIMHLAFDEHNHHIIDNLFTKNITIHELNIILQYCHFNFHKKLAHCHICSDKKIVHKCLECAWWMCTECFIKLNINNKSNKCPQCRLQYKYTLLSSNTKQHIAHITKKYTEHWQNKIISNVIRYDINKNTINRNYIGADAYPSSPSLLNISNTQFLLTGEYCFRDDNLFIQLDNITAANSTYPDLVGSDKCEHEPPPNSIVKLNINKYSARIQRELLCKLEYICHRMLFYNIINLWNLCTNKINQQINNESNGNDLLKFLSSLI